MAGHDLKAKPAVSQSPGRKLCVVCSRIYRGSSTVCPEDGTRLVEAEEDSGSVGLGKVLGHYRLVSKLGEGGVGVLFEAEHVQLGRKMAIKVLHPHVVSDEVVRRFFNEARAVNEIRHPHIVEIEDFVVEPTGEVYLLMELLEGRDLCQIIFDERRLPPERVIDIGIQIADALAAAAELGIVHRDLKPDNVFVIERDGEPDFVKVLDFGIVKFLSDEQGVTHAGMSVGTPQYMPPEQILPHGEVDTRSDVYSLGMLMYEALTGATAFRDAGELAQVLKAQCYDPVVPPSQVLGEPLPPELEAAVMKCLEKSPENRFQDMAELAAALRGDPVEPVLSLEELVAADATPSRGTVRLLLPAVAMILAALALMFVHRYKDEPEASAEQANATAPPASPDAGRTSVASTTVDAAPARPPAPPVKRQPRKVNLQLSSDPAGAVVYADSDTDEPLGTAPFVTEVPVSPDPLRLVARFADGTEVVQSIVPDREPPPIVFVKPQPTPVRRPAKARAPAKAKKLTKSRKSKAGGDKNENAGKFDREGTIDPFAQTVK